MAKKERFTQAEILKDVVSSIKRTTHSSNNKKSKNIVDALFVVLLIAFIVTEIIYPAFVLWVFLLFVVFVPAYLIFNKLRQRARINGVRIENYDVDTCVLTKVEHESYRVKRGVHWYSRVEQINNFTLKFEGGDEWCVPKDNYLWCGERPMSDFAICQSAEEGDEFIVIRQKDNGKIVMAYNTKFFEYKET